MRIDRWISTIPLKLRSIFRRSRVERDLDDEIRFHMEQSVERHIANGMTPEEARYAAVRAMEGVEQKKEECRDMRGIHRIESFIQDMRYAGRMLVRSPGFTAVAVITLALGIGANTAIFRVLDAVVLQPLPVRSPDDLVIVRSYQGQQAPWFGYPLFREMAARQNVVEGLFASSEFQITDLVIDGQRSAGPARGSLVTPGYFRLLGVNARLGRAFSEEEDRAATPVAVVSYNYWRRALGGESNALGKRIQINGLAVTISGIAPAGFVGERLGGAPDLWIPISLGPQVGEGWISQPAIGYLQPMARLRPGVSRTQAQAGLSILYDQLKEFGFRMVGETDYRIELEPGSHGLGDLRQRFFTALWLLMGIVGLVALLGCCNLANLLLARGTSRRQEITVRLALGAGRGRIARQLLTETLMLTCLGAVLGFVIAYWGSQQLIALASAGENWNIPVDANWRMAGFTAFISVAAACLFGLAPAMTATRQSFNAMLQTNQRTLMSDRSRQVTTKALLVAQVSISFLLVAGASLLVHSFWNIWHQDFGYEPAGVLVSGFTFDTTTLRLTRDPVVQRNLQERLDAIPGVQSAALAGTGFFGGIQRPGMLSFPDRQSLRDVQFVGVSPNYFETLRMSIVAGRMLTNDDVAGAERVAVITETTARQAFGKDNPIGRIFSNGLNFNAQRAARVVGVVRDPRLKEPRGLFSAVVFLPFAQAPASVDSVVVRASGNPGALIPIIEKELRNVSSELNLGETRALRDIVGEQLRRERMMAILSGAFALIAIVLAAIGLYGVIAYAVARRTNEIGLRLALGAARGRVVWMVLSENMVVVIAGLILGILATLAAARLVASQLFDLAPWDPATLCIAVSIMLVVTVAASFLPARRASRIDPTTALRYQ